MRKLTFFALALMTIVGCNTSNNEPVQIVNNRTVEATVSIIADTITYPTIIKNNDTNDIWTEKYLSKLNRSGLVQFIVDGVKKGKLQAINYDTEELLSINDFDKILETEVPNQELIGRLLFTESWELDTLKYTFTKSVQTVVVGYELYNEEGELKGYKAVFAVNLNQ